jgi:hypothetical protein
MRTSIATNSPSSQGVTVAKKRGLKGPHLRRPWIRCDACGHKDKINLSDPWTREQDDEARKEARRHQEREWIASEIDAVEVG